MGRADKRTDRTQLSRSIFQAYASFAHQQRNGRSLTMRSLYTLCTAYLHPNTLLMPHTALCVRFRCDAFRSVTRTFFLFIFSFFQVDHQPLSEASLTLVAPCSFVFVMERTWLERTIWGLRIEEPALWKRN